MERKSFLLSAAALTAMTAGNPLLANAQPINASDRNLMAMRTRLESLIAQLKADAHDYGGHRLNAISWMYRAVDQINAALQFDRTHGQG